MVGKKNATLTEKLKNGKTKPKISSSSSVLLLHSFSFFHRFFLSPSRLFCFFQFLSSIDQRGEREREGGRLVECAQTAHISAGALILRPGSGLFGGTISFSLSPFPFSNGFLLSLALRKSKTSDSSSTSPFAFGGREGGIDFTAFFLFLLLPQFGAAAAVTLAVAVVSNLADLKGTLAFLLQSSFLSVLADRFDFKSKKKKRRRGIHHLTKMLWIMRFSGFISAAMVMIILSPSLQSFPPAEAIRSSHLDPYLRFPVPSDSHRRFSFRKAPVFRNAAECRSSDRRETGVCDPSLVHVAITLDVEYLRGSMAAVHSILQHSMCPESVFFHFLVSETDLETLVRSTFPKLKFKVYYFDPEIVRSLISTSVRQALEQPLNYARNYLADLLEPCVRRVIYLDSDLVVVDDIAKLWTTSLGAKTIGAPEYCHTNFSKYFTARFWSERRYAGTFEGRKPCYFNTGVMVIDLAKWRRVGYTKRIERWMEIQRNDRIYELGSLPPFLLVFAGQVAPIEHRWNQHGLGGDNVRGSCRDLHPGPVSLLHWSGSGKPWSRLDSRRPCPLDALWAPYDLYGHSH